MTTRKNSNTSSRSDSINDANIQRIAELEAKVQELSDQLASRQESRPNSGRYAIVMRSVSTWVLALLCAVSLNISVVSIWLQRTVTDTDRWVDTTTRVIQDPAVRAQVATSITARVFEQADVQAEIESILPEKVSGLSGPLTSSLQSFVNDKVNQLLQSDTFIEFWQKANRSAHSGIISSLEQGGVIDEATRSVSVIYIDNDSLVLNLQPVFVALQTRLVQQGLTFVEKIPAERLAVAIPVTEIPQMQRVLFVFDAINKTALYMPIIAVVTGISAVYLAARKRKVLYGIGWFTIVLMVINIQVIYLAKYPLISAALSQLAYANSASAQAVFDILTEGLLMMNRTLLVLSVLLIIAVFVTGHSKIAVIVRGWIARLVRLEGNSKPFIGWIREHLVLLMSAIGLLTVLAVVFPLVRGPGYAIGVVVTGVLLSFIVAVIGQSKSS